MELKKEIEISKELETEIGYNPETQAVVLNVNYEGKYGFSKLENGVKLIAILEKVAASTSNKLDDVAVAALKTLIEKLSK